MPKTVTTWHSDIASEAAPAPASVDDGADFGESLVALADYRVTVSDGVNAGDSVVGSGVGDHPNEPSGMTLITERPFNDLDAVTDGTVAWTVEFDGNPESIVSSGYNGTPPRSGPNVIQFKFAENNGGGGEMGNLGSILFGPFSTVYLHMWVEWDLNWQGHDSFTNKLWFIRKSDPDVGAGDHTLMSAQGKDDGPLSLAVKGQNYCCGDTNPVATGGSLNRGQFYDLEFLITANTPGVKDGILKCWKNGSLVIDRTDWNPFTSTETPTFDGFKYRPIWGGTEDTVIQDMFIWVDGVRVSGKN